MGANDITNLSKDVINVSFEDIKLRKETISLELEIVSLQLKKEELENKKQDREQRGKFAKWIFFFVCGFIMLSLLILTVSEVDKKHLLHLNTSDGVLVALLTTSAANVIGIFAIVTKYLFNTKK